MLVIILLVATLALAGLLASLVVLLAFRRRRARLRQCLHEADLHADAGQDEAALAWVRQGRALAPRDPALLLREAFHRAQLGDVDGALRAYEAAAARTADGYADFQRALLLSETRAEPSRIEDALARSLARTPAYALEAATMETFAPLRGRERFETMLAEARRRLDA